MTDSIIADAAAQSDALSAAPAVISVNATRTGYGGGYASPQELTPRDDIGQLGAPGADGMRPILPETPMNETDVSVDHAADETFALPAGNPAEQAGEYQPLTAADAPHQVPAGAAADQQLQETLGLPPIEERQPVTDAIAETVTAENGTDLTRLLNFNEERGKRSLQQRPKKPRGEGQPQGQKHEGKKPQAAQPKAPQKPSLLRNEKSQNFLRAAMSNRRPDVDGENHLNTSAAATTPLGRLLDMNARTPFDHPDLGHFASVGGLWYYVVGATQDEAFRTAYGTAVRQRGKRVKPREVEGFRTIVAEATWMKVLAHAEIVKGMVANELPYRCYYTVGELNEPQSTQYADWFVSVLEEIGRALKEIHLGGNAEAQPNFDFLERPARNAPRQRQGRDNRGGNGNGGENRPARDRRAQR